MTIIMDIDTLTIMVTGRDAINLVSYSCLSFGHVLPSGKIDVRPDWITVTCCSAKRLIIVTC